MVFWATTSATPTLFMRLGLDVQNPDFLRKTVPKQPVGKYEPVRAMPSHGTVLARFWSEQYCGVDWIMDTSDDWVTKYVNDPTVYIFLLFEGLSIIGSIVSTPLTNGKTIFSNGTVLYDVRAIEGLCIHRSHRGKHLAGFLISYMDWYTASIRPTVHLWSRELASVPFVHTAIQMSTYAYIECAKARHRIPCSQMPIGDFQAYWKTYITSHGIASPAIFTSTPMIRRGDITVWHNTNNEHIAVVAFTRRRMRRTMLPIYEVVWINSTSPAWFLESVAVNLQGVLFASSARHGGGATANWPAPWVYGQSGVHAWYIYNYMPPGFGNCELNIIREEI